MSERPGMGDHMTPPPNANLTDEQRETNRAQWLLTEAISKTDIPPQTTGVMRAIARALVETLRENGAVLVFLGEFEQDVAS